MNDSACFSDATALAAALRRRELSVYEAVETAIARAHALNPAMNAVVAPRYEAALQEARDMDRRIAENPALLDDAPPFLGVPFLMKDTADVAGMPTTYGSRFFTHGTAPRDDDITSRFRRAGMIIFGKTNTPELALLPTTEPTLFGPTRNPWNVKRTAGGSSGGAAAAVAAGIVPVAHANDGGGSIRIPASCCGVFGFKPSRGRTPGNTVTGLSVEHVVTRSVRDSARMLDVLSKPGAWSPYTMSPPDVPFRDVRPDPGPLRIALSDRSPTGERLHPDCVTGLHETARLCESLGHTVERAEPDIDGVGMAESFTDVWTTAAAAFIDEYAAQTRRSPRDDQLETMTWAFIEKSRRISGACLMRSTGYLHAAARRIARFFETYDVWLTPTLTEPPLCLGVLDADRPGGPDPADVFARMNSWVAFPPIANVTGQPAMSVPLYWNGAGIPIGMHFTGRFAQDATLLALALQLEQARPWAHRRPQGVPDASDPLV